MKYKPDVMIVCKVRLTDIQFYAEFSSKKYNWVTMTYHDHILMYPTAKYHIYTMADNRVLIYRYIVNSATGTDFYWKQS